VSVSKLALLRWVASFVCLTLDTRVFHEDLEGDEMGGKGRSMTEEI